MAYKHVLLTLMAAFVAFCLYGAAYLVQDWAVYKRITAANNGLFPMLLGAESWEWNHSHPPSAPTPASPEVDLGFDFPHRNMDTSAFRCFARVLAACLALILALGVWAAGADL